MNQNLIRIFVYGTLRSGGSNHCLLAGSQCKGLALLRGFDMYSLGGFPGIVPGYGEVTGEVYEVTPAVLQSLDQLEGHPHFYLRTQVHLEGDPIFTYVLQSVSELSRNHCITSGDWFTHLEKSRKKMNAK